MRATLVRILAVCIPAGLVLAADSGPASDPLTVAPADYRLLFENEQVRVLEQKMAPKAKEARHYHPARVAVGLTDQLTRITLDGGAEFDRETKSGQATWREGEFHQEANLSDKPSHQVLVELKRAGGDMSQGAAWLQVPGAREAEAADPNRARIALLGSAQQAGPFVERVRFADGYTEKPHRHNGELHMLVLSGRYCLGYGERFERGAAQCHGAGAFLAIQPNLPHYVWSEGVSVVQVEGVGPLVTTNVDGTGAAQVASAAPAPARVEVPAMPPPSTQATVAPTPAPAPTPPAAPPEAAPPPAAPVATASPLPEAPAKPAKSGAPADAKKSAAAAPAAPPPPPAPSGPHVRARDYDFAYEERGQGPPLVLVHGELSDSRAFAQVLNLLAKKHRVISYSRRYHWPNEQAKSGIGYSYTEHADDLVTVLSALGLDRADVLGDGYGGGVVLLAASREPGRFTHLVLIDPDAPELVSDPKIAKALVERDQAVVAEAKRLYKPAEPRDALRLVIDAEFGSGTFDGAGPDLRGVWQQNAPTLALRVADTPGIDCERAKSIAVPMLLLRGARTPDANRAIGRALERCARQAQAIEIADAGHAIQREQPGSFVAAVEIFLGAN